MSMLSARVAAQLARSLPRTSAQVNKKKNELKKVSRTSSCNNG